MEQIPGCCLSCRTDIASLSWTLLLPSLAPRYHFRRTSGISSTTGLAPGGREDVVQRCLGNRPRSGSRLLQSSSKPVIDFSHLNEFVQETPFKMETVASVLLSVREGDFLASIDLKDAYFQIPVHQSSRKLLRFLSKGTVYQFKALCFGLSTALQVFTMVFAAVSAWAHPPQDSFSSVPGRLAGPHLFGGGGQKECLGSALGLSLPRDRDKREVRSRTLTDRALPRYDHRYRGRQDFSVSARVEKFLSVAEMFCTMSAPLAQLWQWFWVTWLRWKD